MISQELVYQSQGFLALREHQQQVPDSQGLGRINVCIINQREHISFPVDETGPVMSP